MIPLFKWNTRAGTFYICQSADGKFHPVFENESLGSYSQAWQAAEDLAGGHTFSNSAGVDTSELSIPDHTNDWERA
ncbi:hypothetical protein [Alteromonas sp. ASW11-130]|uniref:hypothetical protein n=1 Tax=Alteromonas sp. ASW11-130 TaxID=3015775 RepID=UPI002241F7BA|nr:hypothetical protein [Alteromonas sp. ASW11-130]MCW8092120.1 hypothetical protein [Alteromonas sp. ASW11-130]